MYDAQGWLSHPEVQHQSTTSKTSCGSCVFDVLDSPNCPRWCIYIKKSNGQRTTARFRSTYKHAVSTIMRTYGRTFGNQHRSRALHVGSYRPQPTTAGAIKINYFYHGRNPIGDHGAVERSIQWQGQPGSFVRKLNRQWCVTLAGRFFVTPKLINWSTFIPTRRWLLRVIETSI